MKKSNISLFIIIPLLLSSCGKRNDYQQKINLNSGWKFILQDLPAASEKDYNDSKWRTLDLPHDWAIEQPLSMDNPGGTATGFWEGGTAWYRKSISIPSEYINKSIYLQFEGIFRDADVFINGKHAANQKYGYNEFIIDADEYLEYGTENKLAIRVHNIEPMDRWYHGCGIYRDVNMIVANKVHIPLHGTYIRNEVFDSLDASIRISTELRNENSEAVEVMLVSHIFHPEDGKVAVGSSKRFLLKKDTIIEQLIEIEIPDMWSPENPVVYEVFSDILAKNNTILDTYVSTFGIRKVEFTAEQGLVLNWKKVPMKGVCIHHDLGVTGAAFYPTLMRSRLEKLKECGVNAIRLSHNPHDSEVLDMCDEMGFIVIDELFDKWEKSWFSYDTDPIQFMDTWEKDATMFIKRDRNHPSVVIWSAGNETMEQLGDPVRGLEILEPIIKKFNEMDPSREVTCAMHPHGEFPSRLINLTRVVSYNYQVENFNNLRKKFPEKVFIASETKVYHETEPKDYLKLDFSKNTWFMLEEADAGQFIWAGIDYFGESKAWPDKGIRTGFITSNTFIKPYGQFQKSIYSTVPMVHITVLDDSLLSDLNKLNSWQKKWYGPPLASHWNYNKDSVDLYIFTNADEINLELNKNLIGVFNPTEFPGGVIHARIAYEQGEIRAYSSDGNAEHQLQTASKPSKIITKIREYEDYLPEDGIIEIEVWVSDNDGIPCPVSNYTITADFNSSVHFIGADNGDMSDHTRFNEPFREVRDGKCLFVFKKQANDADLITFSSEGLNPATVTF